MHTKLTPSRGLFLLSKFAPLVALISPRSWRSSRHARRGPTIASNHSGEELYHFRYKTPWWQSSCVWEQIRAHMTMLLGLMRILGFRRIYRILGLVATRTRAHTRTHAHTRTRAHIWVGWRACVWEVLDRNPECVKDEADILVHQVKS